MEAFTNLGCVIVSDLYAICMPTDLGHAPTNQLWVVIKPKPKYSVYLFPLCKCLTDVYMSAFFPYKIKLPHLSRIQV